MVIVTVYFRRSFLCSVMIAPHSRRKIGQLWSQPRLVACEYGGAAARVKVEDEVKSECDDTAVKKECKEEVKEECTDEEVGGLKVKIEDSLHVKLECKDEEVEVMVSPLRGYSSPGAMGQGPDGWDKNLCRRRVAQPPPLPPHPTPARGGSSPPPHWRLRRTGHGFEGVGVGRRGVCVYVVLCFPPTLSAVERVGDG